MFVGASCACFSRTWTTYTIYGCSPRLFLSTFNGLHQLLVIIPNFVRGGYNTVTTRMTTAVDITPLLQQINELREMVYSNMRNGEVPPPYPNPSAPPMAHLFKDESPTMDTLFTDDLFDESSEPPRIHKVEQAPKVKSVARVFKEFLQKKGTTDSEANINPDLNVDGAIASNAAGITASSIMPEHPTHLMGGVQYAPQQGNQHQPLQGPRMPSQPAPPLPPPRPFATMHSGRPTGPPPAPQRPQQNQEADYLPMAVLGPSTSSVSRSTLPSPSKRLKTQHRPQPLAPPLSPPEERAATPTDGNEVPKVGNNYLAAKAFARKIYPDVDSPTSSPMETSSMDSPMDTTPPPDTPPSSPMEVASPPPTPTAGAPPAQHPPGPSAEQVTHVAQMIGRPEKDVIAQKIASFFPRPPK